MYWDVLISSNIFAKNDEILIKETFEFIIQFSLNCGVSTWKENKIIIFHEKQRLFRNVSVNKKKVNDLFSIIKMREITKDVN